MGTELDIVIVSTFLRHVRGGAEINDLKLGSALSDLGHDVRYISLLDDSKDIMPIDAQIETVEAPYLLDLSDTVPWPFGKFIRHLNTEWFIWRVQREVSHRLAEADLILSTGRAILARLGDDTSALQFHAVRGSVNPLYHRYLRRADGLVFWGGCEEEYDDESILSMPRVTLDPGIDHKVFRPPERPELSEIPATDDDTCRLTFVGRLEEVKRVDRIIDAVSRLNGRLDQGLELRIVGDGSRRDSLEQRAADVAPGAVEFVGAVDRDRVPAELWATDVFVMASRMENHPIALKEALACGTYCVAPSKGRIPELLDDEKQGIVYGSGVDALTGALEQTITERRFTDVDPAERAKTFDSWDENAAAIVDLYLELVGEQQGDPSRTKYMYPSESDGGH